MNPKVRVGEPQSDLVTPSQALAAPDPEAALRNAVGLWAEQNTRPETLARAEKLRDEVSAVTSFFDFSKKHPGDATPEDVSRWRADMERRGPKPATVYARVSRVSSLYRWLMADPRLSAFIRSNPAAQARPRYPRPYQSESTKALTDDEMNALLRVVGESADSGSVVGKRDYALLLFYFLTGLRRSEVIGLRGKDLESKDGALVIKYRRNGGSSPHARSRTLQLGRRSRGTSKRQGEVTSLARSARCGRGTTGRGGPACLSLPGPSSRT